MADNYLERRMEEYRRSRQGAAVRVKHVAAGLKPGQVVVDYEPMRVLVAGACSPEGIAVVEAFRRFNCRVAITDVDAKGATTLAQRAGAQFHPAGAAAAVERLAAAGDPVSVIVNLDGSVPAVDGITTLTPPSGAMSAGPAAVAAWAIYAAHPVNSWAAGE